MDKTAYIQEIEQRLQRHFQLSKDGYKPPAEDRHRLEGFIQGAMFMGFATRDELAQLMEKAHLNVFDKSIAERRAEQGAKWSESEINYDHYESPAFTRTRH